MTDSTIDSIAWAPLGAGPWPRPTPPRTIGLPATADVVVVGAGITGLSAAIVLAEAGREVVVIDRAFGDGAACRSGGIVSGDTLIGPAPGFSGCEEDLRAWIEAHPIRGGIDWRGCTEFDRNVALDGRPIDWRDAGVVRAARVVAGGTLDPAALVERLAAAAGAAGVRFVDGAQVRACSTGDAGVTLTTSEGAVFAHAVLIATDATAMSRPNDPWPIRALTIAIETTRPSGAALDRAGWTDRRPFYTNDFPLLWGRVLPSGGLLIGRELLPGVPAEAAATSRAIFAAGLRLMARVRGLHAAFVDLDVARVWAGPIARHDDGVPFVRRDVTRPPLVWAGGYGGHGLAQAFRLGRRAATMLLVDA